MCKVQNIRRSSLKRIVVRPQPITLLPVPLKHQNQSQIYLSQAQPNASALPRNRLLLLLVVVRGVLLTPVEEACLAEVMAVVMVVVDAVQGMVAVVRVRGVEDPVAAVVVAGMEEGGDDKIGDEDGRIGDRAGS